MLYLMSSSLYSADQDEMIKTLTTCYNICMKLNQYSDALRCAIKLDNTELMQRAFDECKDRY